MAASTHEMAGDAHVSHSTCRVLRCLASPCHNRSLGRSSHLSPEIQRQASKCYPCRSLARIAARKDGPREWAARRLVAAQIMVLVRAVASEGVLVLINESDTTEKARHEALSEWIRDAGQPGPWVPGRRPLASRLSAWPYRRPAAGRGAAASRATKSACPFAHLSTPWGHRWRIWAPCPGGDPL